MRHLRKLVLLSCLAFVAEATAARHALIIGNAEYAELEDLANTHSDARAYYEAFTDLGFESSLKLDLDLDATLGALDELLGRVDAGDEVAFVYSGHGWSDGNANFLLPTDAPKHGSNRRLKRQSLALSNGFDGLLDELKRANVRLTVAIIDACRNNPFSPPPGGKSVGLGRGLSRIKAPEGTFVVFAAGAGQIALDRLTEDPPEQRLSVFTRTFVPLLSQGLYLEDAIALAQEQTHKIALGQDGHEQRPSYYDETIGKTCLSGNCQAPVPSQSGDQTAFIAALQAGTAEALDEFIRDHPESEFVVAARTQREKFEEIAIGEIPEPATALLYEEGATNESNAAFKGTVTWKLEQQEGTLPQIIGQIDVAQRDLTVDVIVRRNEDPSLAASHLIEMSIKAPSDAIGGGILDVRTIVLKESEAARGDPLAAVSAKVSDSLFWIALSSNKSDLSNNVKLISERGWFDLPIQYSNNRRAIISFEKGMAGEKVFAQAFAAWEEHEGSRENLSSENQVLPHTVAIPSGLTSYQIAAAINHEVVLTGRITKTPAEGSLMPGIYKFAAGDSRQKILALLQNEHKRFVERVWQDRSIQSPITSMEELVTLASIVELETRNPEDYGRVAAVFINRLNKGMRLQVDSTLIYSLSHGKGSLGRSLSRSDIGSSDPYNTYVIEGLPPGPIANPSREALEAVINPAQTDDLFFVSDGAGGLAFAATLTEHQKNVAKWRQLERDRTER